MNGLYLAEFPDYDGEFYIPEGWEDVSYHNDLCPHVEIRNKAETVITQIWQDYADPQKREYEDRKRYAFMIRPSMGDATFYYETDDLNKIKELVKCVL